MKKLTSALAVIALASAALTGLATASSATANTPCTNVTVFGSGQFKRAVPTTAGGSSDCYLVQGNTGNGVRALQRALVYCEGYSVGTSGVDGSFGQATRTALTSFQSGMPIATDGQYGNQTRNWIKFVDRASNPTGAFFCNRF